MMTGKKVLLVEDNADNSALATYLLKHAGYIVTAAHNSEAALKALNEELFDILLCDISLPGDNGHVLLTKIKMNPKFQNLCAIAVSAYAREEDKYRCLEIGYDAFIEKPIEMSSFADTVSRIYEKKILLKHR